MRRGGVLDRTTASTDGQQKEKTIESQLAELRQQVAAAGHELVNEYIDDAALLVLPKTMALVTQPDWAARMKKFSCRRSKYSNKCKTPAAWLVRLT